MSARLQTHFQQYAEAALESYTAEQLLQLHREADELASEARLASMEQRMLEGDVEEIQSTIVTLESLQGCLAAVQTHPDAATLHAIHRAVTLQQERLGLTALAPALESDAPETLTASMESAIWDTIKRLWAALMAMCKRLIAYVLELFRGNAAKQKAYVADVEAGRLTCEQAMKDAAQPATEDFAGSFDAGILVSASAAVKDALNVVPREGKIDLKGLLSDGIADTRTLSQLKDRLFQGLQILEQFPRGEQVSIEAAINKFTEALSQSPLQSFRGPKVEGKAVHYHSKWLHPVGGLMVVMTPVEASSDTRGHAWPANERLAQVVGSITVKPYRDGPLEDKDGASLRLSKPEIRAFFTDVREFGKAAAGYNIVYKTLFQSFDQRQSAAVKPFADTLNSNSDSWADIKDSAEKRTAYMVNHNACAFITQLVHLAQKYAQIAQQTSTAHTKVLAGASALTRALAVKLTKKKAA